MIGNVSAILNEGIVEAFWHVNVATENASQRWALDFVDRVNEVVLTFFLLHRQLQLTDGSSDVNLQYDILSLLLV